MRWRAPAALPECRAVRPSKSRWRAAGSKCEFSTGITRAERLLPPDRPLHTSHDGPARHHDARYLLVMRCGDIGELHEGPQRMLAPRAVEVPQRVRIARTAAEGSHAGPGQQVVRKTSAPLRHYCLRWVVEYVSRYEI